MIQVFWVQVLIPDYDAQKHAVYVRKIESLVVIHLKVTITVSPQQDSTSLGLTAKAQNSTAAQFSNRQQYQLIEIELGVQQRLTTVTLLITALSEFVKENKSAIETNATKLQDRALILAKKACQIWFAPNLPESTLTDYQFELKEPNIYTIEQYEYLRGNIFDLYKSLEQRVLNIDSSVYHKFKKLYIAFKSSINFIDVIPQKTRLLLMLNLPFSNIIDPKGICRDVTGLELWGNGDVNVSISNINELDDVMTLIQQSFDFQMES
ncbi:DUF5655 domain-containing protein [Aliivibrio fischeri]|uniref:DUF5655 domain-containing protein n=1 Tax=Aliivibrio fischeri TaxID=668 RepID=UPI0012DA0A91|nr:DUF5655 domain-containing protein [Aliivibrio fischeri]